MTFHYGIIKPNGSSDMDYLMAWRSRQRKIRRKIEQLQRLYNNRHKPRNIYDRKDTAQCVFQVHYINEPRCRDHLTLEGKQFRRRFRVPYTTFENIVAFVRSQGYFTEGDDAIGKKSYSLELKVLGALRVLGRGICFDDVAELTNMSAETHRVFFKKFVYHVAKDMYEQHVFRPTTNVDIENAMHEYKLAGNIILLFIQ